MPLPILGSVGSLFAPGAQGLALHQLELDAVAVHSGQLPTDQYWLTDLGGDLRLREKGPSIGTVQWIGMRREVRALPYPSESQLQLACDLDPWTLERLEKHRDGQDLTLWIELWPRLEHPGGYLSASPLPCDMLLERQPGSQAVTPGLGRAEQDGEDRMRQLQ